MEIPPQVGFLGGSDGEKSACIAGDPGSIPGLGRSPGDLKGYPLQYSCLGIPWTEKPGGLKSIRLQRVGHYYVTNTYIYTYCLRCQVMMFRFLL